MRITNNPLFFTDLSENLKEPIFWRGSNFSPSLLVRGLQRITWHGQNDDRCCKSHAGDFTEFVLGRFHISKRGRRGGGGLSNEDYWFPAGSKCQAGFWGGVYNLNFLFFLLRQEPAGAGCTMSEWFVFLTAVTIKLWLTCPQYVVVIRKASFKKQKPQTDPSSRCHIITVSTGLDPRNAYMNYNGGNYLN